MQSHQTPPAPSQRIIRVAPNSGTGGGGNRPPLVRAHSNEVLRHVMESELTANVVTLKEEASVMAMAQSLLVNQVAFPSGLVVPTPIQQPSALVRAASLQSFASGSSPSPSLFGSNLSLASVESGETSSSTSTAASTSKQPNEQPQQQKQVMPSQTSESSLLKSANGSSATRNSVHIIWSISDVPFPSNLSAAYVIDRVQRTAEVYGTIGTFKAVSYTDETGSAATSSLIKRCLHEHGVEYEEVYRQAHTSTLDISILTNVLRVALNELELQRVSSAESSSSNGAPAMTKSTTLMLLVSQDEFSRAVQVLLRSHRFTDIIVVYHGVRNQGSSAMLSSVQEPQALIRHASVSLEWSQLLRHGLATPSVITFEPLPLITPAAQQPLLSHHHRQHHHDRYDHSHGARSSSYKDLSAFSSTSSHHGSGLPSYPSLSIPSVLPSRVSTPSSNRSSYSTPPLSSNFNFASTATNSRSSSISSTAQDTTLPPISFIVTQPASTTATASGSAGGRNMMGAVLDVQPAFDANTTNIGELSVELMLERLAPKLRTMVLAFRSVLLYCETERIIPRESVLKKRLLDTSIGVGSQMADVDFEHLLALSVQCGVAAVEGKAPQRVIYPAAGVTDGKKAAIRKFDCADFFQPTQRLTVDQTEELLRFLSCTRPEVDRGRFGFAQYLSLHAPLTIRSMPHGVLVELVQLLLNQKILLFRKGRVSTNPNLCYADLRALAALSIASKPHATLLATVKGAQGQHAASQLRQIYLQLQHDIDLHNANKMNRVNTLQGQPSGVDKRSTLPTMNSDATMSLAHPSRPFSAPVSPTISMKNDSSWTSFQLPPAAQSTNELLQDEESLGGFSLPTLGEFDTSLLDSETPSTGSLPTTPSQYTSTVDAITPNKTRGTSLLSISTSSAWKPTSPFGVSNQSSWSQILTDKFVASKFRSADQQATTRIPLAPLWHYDLRMLPSSSSSSSQQSWSATCSFDVCDDVHTFSATSSHRDTNSAMESLARQVLDTQIVWRMSWNSVVQEVKITKCERRSSGTSKELPFLIKDEAELREIDENDESIRLFNARDIEQKICANPMLALDVLLSSIHQPPMIYSCEQVEISMKPDQRVVVWSVAAALPMSFSALNAADSAESITSQVHATSLKENKLDAKIECARQLLDKLKHSKQELSQPNQQQQAFTSETFPSVSQSSSSPENTEGAPTITPSVAAAPTNLPASSSSSTTTQPAASSPPIIRMNPRAAVWTPQQSHQNRSESRSWRMSSRRQTYQKGRSEEAQ